MKCHYIYLLILVACVFAGSAVADNSSQALTPSSFLNSDGQEINLWGVVQPIGLDSKTYLKARSNLDNLLNSGNISCDEQVGKYYCKNSRNIDIGLAMIQAGYLLADKSAVYMTALSSSYIEAEKLAMNKGVGVWKDVYSVENNLNKNSSNKSDLRPFLAIVVILMAIFLPLFFISRKLSRLEGTLKETSNLMVRKVYIEKQEKIIIAATLEAEMRSNKTKADAFLIIYEEQLNKLKKIKETPTYRRSGDVIHKNPSLQRVAFDKLSGKLSILGSDLSERIAKFYDGVSGESEYIDLTPDMPMKQAISILQEAIENCKKLDSKLQDIISGLEKITQSRSYD